MTSKTSILLQMVSPRLDNAEQIDQRDSRQQTSVVIVAVCQSVSHTGGVWQRKNNWHTPGLHVTQLSYRPVA